MTKRKHKKLSEEDISNLKKNISEVKDVFKESHLAPEPEKTGINTLSEAITRGRDSIGAFRYAWENIANIISPNIYTNALTASAQFVGGRVTDGSNTLFTIRTAEIHHSPIPMGSGITSEYTITAIMHEGQHTIQVTRDYTYGFYFNAGGRIYEGLVKIDGFRHSSDGPEVTLKVVGALNIT